MYKIEKNIPIAGSGAVKQKYPFGGMDVGDSFFVEEKNAISAKAAAYQYASRSNLKYTTRKVDGGIRIWRVA